MSRASPRRSSDASNRLDLYQRALTDANGPLGDVISVEIRASWLDEIAEVTIIVPGAVLERVRSGPLLTLATRGLGDGRSFAPVITQCSVTGAAATASCARVGLEHGDSRVEIEVPNTGSPSEDDLTISFFAWEIVSPPFGEAPYVQATLDVVFDFPALSTTPVTVTLIVPEDTEPRSIQGSHVLAYPSRTYESRRYLNLYFRRDRAVQLAASFGPTNEVTTIWLSFAKLAGAVALVAFLGSLRSDPGDTERYVAVIASLAALLGVAGDVLRQFSELRLYRQVGRGLQRTLTAAQAVGVIVIVISLERLRHEGDGLFDPVVPVAVGVVALSLAAMAAGLALHYRGFWHRFVCDQEGCATILRFRRGRRECSYTGRVFCNEHIDVICARCVHYPDLISGEMRTKAKFDPATIPCRAANTAEA